MNSNRGAMQCEFDFAREADQPLPEELLRPELTDSASVDQPALSVFLTDALMEHVVDPVNLDRAWRQVKSNRGVPGPDGMTIKQFEPWARENWPTVRQQLLDGTYRPGPVRRKTIRKEGGGERLLGIPNVLDRLIQQAICQVLTPIFDPDFSEWSFGFRPNRSAHGAIKQAQRIIVKSVRSAERVFASVQCYLTQHLKLVVNQQKSSVRLARGCEYLGFTFSGSRVTIKVAPKKLKAFKRRVKQLTGRSRGISMRRRLTDLNRYLRGWISGWSNKDFFH